MASTKKWMPRSRHKAPTAAELQVRQLDALREHFGWTPAQLEAAWREAVLGNKGRR